MCDDCLFAFSPTREDYQGITFSEADSLEFTASRVAGCCAVTSNIDTNPRRRRLIWPWLLGVIVFLGAMSFVPAIIHPVLALDASVALQFNRLLGASPAFDRFVGMLNTKLGDALITLGAFVFIGIHILLGRRREEVARRLAFWSWTLLLFVLFYQLQRMIEHAFSRDSPSVALPGWKLHEYLEAHKVKVSNTHSFPSGHASAYYFVAFMALVRYRGAGLLLLAAAVVLPTTRIITGAHWPTDGLIGSTLLMGLFVALCYETPLACLYVLFEKMWQDLCAAIAAPGGRPLSDRLKAAWRELVAPANGKQ